MVESVTASVNNESNSELLKVVSDEEVKTALFQMNPDKSPGPTG